MAKRVYISKVIGDGITIDTAFRPAWWDIDATIPQYGNAIESERYFFWLGELDTDDAQHAALMADNRVRYIPQALIATTVGNLTAGQITAILEVMTWLGFPTNIFSNNARVADILFYIVGRSCWHPVKQAADA